MPFGRPRLRQRVVEVVAPEDARVALVGEDVGVGRQLVVADGVLLLLRRVVVVDEGDGALRLLGRERPAAGERPQREAVGVAQLFEAVAQREVEG